MNISDALSAAAKGAGMGMALGPVGAVAGGAAGLVLDLAPELGKWIFGGGTTGERTVAAVAGAVEKITGTSDAQDAAKAVAADPGLGIQLRVELAKIAAARQAEADAAQTARLQAVLSDVASARSQTVSLAASHSVMAWGAPVVSVIVLASFGVMLWLAIRYGFPAENASILNVLLGTLAAMATSVVSYWVGSSYGSTRKTDIIAAGPAPATTTISAPPAPPVTVTTGGAPPPPIPAPAPPAPLPFPVSPSTTTEDWRPLNFDDAFNSVVGLEGGYVNDPKDPGGETNWGISKKSYPDLDIKNLSLRDAKQIYIKDYWLPLFLDKIYPTIAYELFDFAVNSGVSGAVDILQRLVGANEDKKMGPITIKAINDYIKVHGVHELATAYMAARLDFMRSLPAWKTYARGWSARVASVEAKADSYT